MAGNDQCIWAVWFKTHFQNWSKVESDFNFLEWQMGHTILLQTTATREIEAGRTVTLEEQNKFNIAITYSEGEITIAGKPDLISKDPETNIRKVIDAKTGKPRTSDAVQLQLYMYCDVALDLGEIVYMDRSVLVTRIDQAMSQIIEYWFQQIGNPDREPLRVPSERECSWCDITKEDCPARIEKG
jgi:hypothetical protein